MFHAQKNKILVNETAQVKYSIILIVGQSNTHSGIGLYSKLDTTEDGISQLGLDLIERIIAVIVVGWIFELIKNKLNKSKN